MLHRLRTPRAADDGRTRSLHDAGIICNGACRPLVGSSGAVQGCPAGRPATAALERDETACRRRIDRSWPVSDKRMAIGRVTGAEET
ncbi:MAG: hypothetical protein KJ018_02660 [Burkholderiales bacterium]|nr:hypothetical protein [Burkholderiales bacterium]